MARSRVRFKRRKVCIGDLDKRLKLFDRSLEGPSFGQTDFALDFERFETVWCGVNTTNGKTLFDSVALVDVAITHEIYIRYRDDVTSETWAETSDGRRLKIVSVENLDSQSEMLRLLCSERGKASQEATKA